MYVHKKIEYNGITNQTEKLVVLEELTAAMEMDE